MKNIKKRGINIRFINKNNLNYILQMILNNFIVLSVEDLYFRLLKGGIIKLKWGIDPSKNQIHIGHIFIINRIQKLLDILRDKVFIDIIIGTFTANIGENNTDPNRLSLTKERSMNNAIFFYLNLKKFFNNYKNYKIHFNHLWLNNIDSAQMFKIARHIKLSIIADKFKNNFTPEKISLSTCFYPLLQSYDNLYLSTDIEIGGYDQLTNIIVSRKLSSLNNLKSTNGFFVPLLTFRDENNCIQKFSKSNSKTSVIQLKDSYSKFKSKIHSLSINNLFNLIEKFNFININKNNIKFTKTKIFYNDLKDKFALFLFSKIFRKNIIKVKKTTIRKIFIQLSYSIIKNINISRIISYFTNLSKNIIKKYIKNKSVLVNNFIYEKNIYNNTNNIITIELKGIIQLNIFNI